MLEGRTCYVGLLMDLPTSSLYSPVPQHTYFFFLGLHEYKIVQISGSNRNVSGEGDTASLFALIASFWCPYEDPECYYSLNPLVAGSPRG